MTERNFEAEVDACIKTYSGSDEKLPQQLRRGSGCIRDYFRDNRQDTGDVRISIRNGEVFEVAIVDSLAIWAISKDLEEDVAELLEGALGEVLNEVLEENPTPKKPEKAQKGFDPAIQKQPEHPLKPSTEGSAKAAN